MVWSAGQVVTASQLNTYAPQERTAWTPTITAASGTFTTVSSSGRYAVYGPNVLWSLTITITTAGTATGDVLFPLPFAAQSAPGHLGSGRESAVTGFSLEVYTIVAGTARVTKYDNTTIIADGRILRLSGCYEKA